MLVVGGGSVASAADDAQSPETVTGEEYEQMHPEGAGFPELASRAESVASGCAGPFTGWARPFEYATTHAKNCNIAGSSGYRKYYRWSVGFGSSGRACSQGKGYNSSGTIWKTLGCGTGGNGTVDWGKRLSYPSYKAISLVAPLGTLTQWY